MPPSRHVSGEKEKFELRNIFAITSEQEIVSSLLQNDRDIREQTKEVVKTTKEEQDKHRPKSATLCWLKEQK